MIWPTTRQNLPPLRFNIPFPGLSPNSAKSSTQQNYTISVKIGSYVINFNNSPVLMKTDEKTLSDIISKQYGKILCNMKACMIF